MSKKLHALLSTQIKHHLPESALGQNSKAIQAFLQTVSAVYEDADLEREHVARAMVELQAIYSIAVILQSPPTASKYFKVAQEIAKATEFPIVAIKILQRETSKYKIVALLGAGDHFASFQREDVPPEETNLTDLDVPFWCDDFRESDRPSRLLRKLNAASVISVTMKAESMLIGVVTVGHPEPGRCSPGKIKWLNSVAGQVASATERSNLSNLSEHQNAVVFTAAKMSELGKMAGGIAHEINTPLNTIMLMANTLKEDATTHGLPELAASAAKIESTVERIATIVRGLRTFSRDGSRDPFLATNVAQIVRGTVALCSERFGHNLVKLKVDMGENVIIKCRETQISQLLLNLLNNAADAIQKFSEKWILIQVRDLGDMIELSVTDSGKGIPLKIQEKLAIPFFTTKELGEGTGLGLSISTGIAKDHGGHVQVDNSCANTRFVVTLAKDPAQQTVGKTA